MFLKSHWKLFFYFKFFKKNNTLKDVIFELNFMVKLSLHYHVKMNCFI